MGESSEKVKFKVPSMDCQDCAKSIESQLEAVEGVESYSIIIPQRTAEITYDASVTDESAIEAAIEKAGYSVVSEDTQIRNQSSIWTSRRGLLTIIGSVLLVLGIFLEFIVPTINATAITIASREITLAWLAYGTATVLVGHIIVRNGYYAAINRQLNIQLLMSVGILSALLINLPFEAATLAVLFSIAELLERFSVNRAQESLHELIELTPDTATVLQNGDEKTVPVESLGVDDTVIVRPGTRIPTDGTVATGSSAVDESPVTGESMPVDKTPGDTVYSGSIVQSGYLEVTVTAPADESTIAKVIELVENAQQGTTSYERFVDRFAAYYTPVILIGALLTLVFTPYVFGITRIEGFVRGLTLLVIACPCALVISTPVSIVSGVTSGARNGVLIKSGDHLEQTSHIDVVAFDKTGTLTTGTPSVSEVIPLQDYSVTEILEIAGSLEFHSEHPLADAIVAHADQHNVETGGVSEFESVPGNGVTGTIDDVKYFIGKPGLFENLDASMSKSIRTDGGEILVEDHGEAPRADSLAELLDTLESAGKTVILVGTETNIIGVITITDSVRSEAKHVITQLQERGLVVSMLTGDNQTTANAIATELGIDSVHADLLPDEKVDMISELRDSQGPIAMIGDGINDGPALAAADVGIAMGAAGTDTALETADVALMADDLTKLPYLFSLADTTDSVIRQNVWAAILVKAALAIGAPFGVVSVITAIIIGDMGMSLGVTSNALRLGRLRPANEY